MPPPDHFEYTLKIGPGTEGQLIFLPDYPGKKTPNWTEEFSADPEVLSALYEMLLKHNLLNRIWPEPEQWTDGGCLEWAEIIADGLVTKIPSFAQDPDLDELYAAVRKIRPEKIWTNLLRKRESYQKRYNRKNKN